MRYMYDGVIYDTEKMDCVYSYSDGFDTKKSYYRVEKERPLDDPILFYIEWIHKPSTSGDWFNILSPEVFRQYLEDRFNELAKKGMEGYTLQETVLQVYEKEFWMPTFASTRKED